MAAKKSIKIHFECGNSSLPRPSVVHRTGRALPAGFRLPRQRTGEGDPYRQLTERFGSGFSGPKNLVL
jgi:hypothetical protein